MLRKRQICRPPYCLIILAATDGMTCWVFSTQWKNFRLDKQISTRGKKSRLVVRIRLEEIIRDSTKIVSTRGKNYRLDHKILDSMKKFSTPWKNSRLHEKILDSKKKIFSTGSKKIFSTREKNSRLEKKSRLDHFCPLKLAIKDNDPPNDFLRQSRFLAEIATCRGCNCCDFICICSNRYEWICCSAI